MARNGIEVRFEGRAEIKFNIEIEINININIKIKIKLRQENRIIGVSKKAK